MTALGFAATPASAHKNSFPTDAQGITGGIQPDGLFLLLGRIVSPKDACEADRTVKMIFVHQDGSRRVADRARSSRHGAFALGGDPTNVDAAFLRAPQKLLARNKRHRHVCRPDGFALGS
ncbi:MAG TPA: hypothetical protein VK919_00425 [Solirubrobacterales bacterium]|nr:hypothetical protein [Solirubrobacterales bacterium]